MDTTLPCDYDDVKNNCKGGIYMRKHYLDNIRWITVVIVVIYHVLYMYNAEGILGGLGKITSLSVQPYDILMYLVYPWFMPVLFIVSGISSRLFLERHTDKEFIISRSRKLLVPSTIGVFVFHFIQGYVSMSLSNAFSDLGAMGVPKPVIYLIMVASGSGVLWFMHLLWIYSMILVLLRLIEKGRLLKAGGKAPIWLILLLYFPIWGAAQILNTPIIAVYRIGFYFVFYMFGYYVFSNDEVMEKLKRYAIPFLAAGAVLCIGAFRHGKIRRPQQQRFKVDEQEKLWSLRFSLPGNLIRCIISCKAGPGACTGELSSESDCRLCIWIWAL